MDTFKMKNQKLYVAEIKQFNSYYAIIMDRIIETSKGSVD